MTRTPLFALILPVALGCQPAAPTDVTLEKPANGFQLSTDSFVVDSGVETQRCYFFTVPGTGTDPVYVHRVVATQNPGSHHLNVFRVKTVVNLDGNPGDPPVVNGECFKSGNWADWPLVTNLQNSGLSDNLNDWTLPAGVDHVFQPGEKLMLQIHYVNATTQQTPGHGKGIVNFYTVDASQHANALGTVFATDQMIKVCPGQTNVSYTASCNFAKGQPVTIIGANGHFHSRGVQFTIEPTDAMGVAGATFYTSTQWSDPPFSQNLNVQIPTGGGFQWDCSYSMPANDCGDPANMCCCTFGGHVETQEHCNAFVYYYPEIQNASCF
jgi:hypothetical protein